MKYLITSCLFIFSLLLSGCFYQSTGFASNGYLPITKNTKKKYKSVNFAENEIRYAASRSYIKTLIDDNNYIYRQFYNGELITYTRIEKQPNEIVKTEQKRWYDNGQLWDEGTLINGVKEGSWIENSYYEKDSTSTTKKVSHYKKGLKTGEEVIYFSDGTTKAIYNYKNNLKDGAFVTYDSLGFELCKGTFKKDNVFENACGNTNEYNENIEPSTFPGGEKALLTYLYSKIRYPAYAKQQDIQGICIVRFTVNEVGNIEDIKVIRTLDTSIKNEIISIIKRMPKWIPGILDGQPIKSEFTLPVNFKLE